MRLWLAAYLAMMLIGAAVFGDVWFERADPFEVYSSLLAKLSVWGRDGRRGSSYAVRWRTSPPSTPRPGLVAVVAVLFGSTAFDTYKDTLAVAAVRHRRRPRRRPHQHGRLLVFCLVVGGTFTVAAMSTGVETTGPNAVRRTDLPACWPTR